LGIGARLHHRIVRHMLNFATFSLFFEDRHRDIISAAHIRI
jgi:hypothetical protein